MLKISDFTLVSPTYYVYHLDDFAFSLSGDNVWDVWKCVCQYTTNESLGIIVLASASGPTPEKAIENMLKDLAARTSYLATAAVQLMES